MTGDQSDQTPPDMANGATVGQDAGSTPQSGTGDRTVILDLGEGRRPSVTIAGFDHMSPADQAEAVQQIAAHLQNGSTAQPTPNDTSFTSALGYGLHNAAEGIGKTAELVGNATGWNGLESAGKSLEGATSAPANYQPTDLAGDLRSGAYAQAARDLPRAAVEGGADLAGYLGAGAIAGPLGVGAVAAARNLGDNVAARAANNGDATPSAGDWVGGGLTTAGQSALAAVGLGKAGIGRTLISAAPAIARPVVAAGLDAAAGGASSALGQLGASAGTDQGAQLDPYQVEASGLQAGAGRLASTAPELAAVGIRAGTDAAMSSLQPAPASTADAASIVRVYGDYQAAQSRAQATRGDTSPMAVFNSLKSDYVSSATDTIDALQNSGQVTPPQARSLRSLFQDQAQRANNTITSDGAGYATLFDKINDLPISDEDANRLQNAARDLNTLSTQSFQNRADGPFRQLGKGLATVAGVGGALYAGSPLAAVGILAGHGYVSPVAGAVGGMLDRSFRMNTPTVVLRANAARKMLAATGTDAGPSSLAGLQAITAAANALPPPGPSIADLAQNRLDRMAQSNAIKLKIAAAGQLPTPHPEIDDTAVDAAVNNALKQADAVVRQAGNVPVAPAGWNTTPPPPAAAVSPAAPLPAALQAVGLPLGAGSAETSRQTAGESGPLQPMPTPPGLAPAATVATPGGMSSGSSLPMTAPAGHPDAPGWERYMANGSPNVTRQDVHDAVDATYTPAQAAVLKAHPGGVDVRFLLPVQQRLAQMRQAANTSTIGLPTMPASPASGGVVAAPDQLAQVGIGPVRNPLAYQGSIDNHRALVMNQIGQAQADGVPEAVPVLQAIMQAHGPTPEATRQAKLMAAATALKVIGDAQRRAGAMRYLTRPILAHGGPKGGGR